MNGERWVESVFFFFFLFFFFTLFPAHSPPTAIMHTLHARAHVALSPSHTHTHPLAGTVAHSIRRRDSTTTLAAAAARGRQSAPPERRHDDFFFPAHRVCRLPLSRQLYYTHVRVVPRTVERQLLQLSFIKEHYSYHRFQWSANVRRCSTPPPRPRYVESRLSLRTPAGVRWNRIIFNTTTERI
ncbi:unnamed protein product [Aphis gossypii]|uniref:Secreted protein n=1 Tax=Aphis gossypii TaxID=80765 RepID=A0A9P0ITW0_APHGO|nr:unnamed protein product [Aphis gossypii]